VLAGTGKSKLPAIRATAASLAGGLLLSACSYGSNPPLVFGQAHTVGVSIHGSATQQGADLTVGYRDVDIAVVPVTAVDASGRLVRIKADVADKDGGVSSNSLSVLGQFEVDAQAAGPKVGLGKFFATGLAADKLADGFNAKLSK
jgi:hypothetical protein